MITLHQLTPKDAPLLSRIGGISLIESHGHSATPEIMNEYVDRSFSEEACHAELSDERNIFYAAFYNNEPAGYSKIICNVPHKDVPLAPVTKLERIYLLKEYYGLKLGHFLLHQAIDISKASGEKGMWLNVWKGNPRAIRFYEKEGFKTVGESLFVLTETHANPNWVMLKEYGEDV